MQNYNASIVLSVLLLMIGAVGCAIFGDNDVLLDEADAHLHYGCGVSDGGAVEILIPNDPVSSCSAWESIRYKQPWPQTFVRIYLSGYGGSGSDSLNTVLFGSQQNQDLERLRYYWGGLCVEGEESCVEASTGQILLPATPGDPFETQVDILFEDGSAYSRQLEVFVCEPDPDLLCG